MKPLPTKQHSFIFVTALLFAAGVFALVFATAEFLPLHAQTDPAQGDDVRPASVDGPDIRGGRESTPGAWPWQAALVYSGYENAYAGQFCGGSLIDAEWILTAAHCVVSYSATSVEVVLGRHQLSLDDGERISVTDIVVYPDYYSAFDGGDLALLRLSRPSTHTVVMLDTNTTDLVEERSINGTVIGWGASDENYYGSDVLREVALPFVSLETCRDAYYYYGEEAIPDAMVCAGYAKGAKSACYGDSGGPLMIPNDSEVGWTQVGIVSWGRGGCSGYENYNVYTRVSTYTTWINDCIAMPETNCLQIDQFEPDDTPATATVISTDGISQTHNFHGPEDRDWLKFEAKADTLYWIETSGIGLRSDTILWIYAADGVTALAYNDDNSEAEQSSKILWQAPADGTYYIEVDNHWQSIASATEYRIMVMPVAAQIYLPEINYFYYRPITIPGEQAPAAEPTATPTLIILPTLTTIVVTPSP